MASRGKHVARMAILLLLIGGVSTNCAWMKRMRQTPRQHWWEIWKPKRPQGPDLIYPGDLNPEPPPPPPRIDSVPAPEPTRIPDIGPVEPVPGVEPIGDVPPEPEPVRREPAGMINQLQTVHFEFDQYRLTPEAVRILDANAEFLLAHAEVRVLIEGHCDERGTVEYNFQLGQRRADAVREYLIARGVTADQLNTISFGEERPIDPGHNEAAWGKNRRAQFQIY